MTSTDKQLKLALELKDDVLERYRPGIIILFGSVGPGDFDELGDVDLLVVIDIIVFKIAFELFKLL